MTIENIGNCSRKKWVLRKHLSSKQELLCVYGQSQLLPENEYFQKPHGLTVTPMNDINNQLLCTRTLTCLSCLINPTPSKIGTE